MEYKYFHHISVAVKSREEGMATYVDKLGFPPGPLSTSAQGTIRSRFYLEDGRMLELLEPSGPETVVGHYIARRGEGLYMISLAVDSLPETIRELRAKGLQLLNVNAEGTRGTETGDPFIHPRFCHRVLVQIAERPTLTQTLEQFGKFVRDYSGHIRRLDHVVIAVKDLNEGIATYRDTLGMTLGRRGQSKALGVKQAIFPIGGEGCFVELVEPLGPETPVGQFLERRGEGFYMTALAVDNLGQTVHDLKAKGVQLIGGERPRDAVFIHPDSAHGALLQLVERT